MDNNNNRIKTKSFGFQGIFLVLNQILNIILTLLNLGYGNLFCLILELLNSISGIILYLSGVRETTLLISSISFIAITSLIFLYYHHEIILFLLIKII